MLITIGAFDGFHKGHQELLRLCRENADGNNWAVISFWPHPAEYMHKFPHTLFTLRERELIRRVLDIPKMYILEFSEALRTLSASDFLRRLSERFSVDGLVMGRDFHFGLNREGSAENLSHIAQKVIVADLKDKAKYSSSHVRDLLSAGKVEAAMDVLGYPCFLEGRIMRGYHRGRTMHFPTANLDITGRIIPTDGVYASAVLVNGEWHCGAVSIGKNPTFHDVVETRLEVYILDFSGNIYGEKLPVFFLGRVRDMREFADKDALMTQISHDILMCRKIYEDAKNVSKFLARAGRLYDSERLTPEIIRLV